MKVVVVVPTYNEVENISRLLPALLEEFKKINNHEIHVLVVDGNSPDGTSEVVRKFKSDHNFVHLLTEEKKAGLGAAYIQGFKYAVESLNADVLIEMDADFQHDPKEIKSLIYEIDNGFDYVLGSRYTNGINIPKEWALYRKFLSVGGNLFTKLVLGIYSVGDFTTGFKASRVAGFVDKLNLDSITSKGFAYKMDLLYQMYKLGAKIKEVPITFGVRDRGNSKMERDNALDSLRVVLTIRLRDSKSFLKFVAVGFIGLFVDTGLSNILRLSSLAPNVATTTAAGIAMTVTFLFNNFWSFSDRKIMGVKKFVSQIVLYFSVSVVPLIFRYFFVGYVVSKFGNTFIYFNLAIFVSIAFGLVWNYFFYSKLVWKDKS